jgi:hypothetical protein
MICDIPTRSELSISGDACQEIQGSRGSENWGFHGQGILASWNHDPRYPDKSQDSVGHNRVRVEDRWHSNGDWEKASLETLGIRIRNPTNPEISREAMGSEKVEPHMCIGVSSRQISGVGKSKCLI